MTGKVNLWLTRRWPALIRLVSMTYFNCKATLTNNTNYSYYIKPVEPVEPII